MPMRAALIALVGLAIALGSVPGFIQTAASTGGWEWEGTWNLTGGTESLVGNFDYWVDCTSGWEETTNVTRPVLSSDEVFEAKGDSVDRVLYERYQRNHLETVLAYKCAVGTQIPMPDPPEGGLSINSGCDRQVTVGTAYCALQCWQNSGIFASGNGVAGLVAIDCPGTWKAFCIIIPNGGCYSSPNGWATESGQGRCHVTGVSLYGYCWGG